MYYRNPTPSAVPVDLKPFNDNATNYVEISNNGLVLGVDPHGDSYRFWAQLLDKHRSLFKLN